MGLFRIDKIKPEDNMMSPVVLLKPGSSSDPPTATFIPKTKNQEFGPPIPIDILIERSQTEKVTGRHINLIENFNNWVVSPILNNIYKNDIKLPAIQLKEYRLLDSTLWNQVKYFAYILQSNPGRAADKIATTAGTGQDSWLVKTLRAAQDTVDTTFGLAAGVLEDLNIDTPDFSNLEGSDPYEGLYSPTETGFQYTFPLYNKDMKTQVAGFRDSYSGDGKGLLYSTVHNLVEGTANKMSTGGRALVEPGIYIEKTQFYDYGQNLESINFSFPLLNTLSQEQINQNYQFIFLLLYQNTMFRKDRAAFIPPCIYEVLVPGIRYMRYAHISRLKVDFLGTRRMIEVDPGIAPGPFKTIIPEAYDVNITITNLHEEGGNYIIRSAANSFEDIKIRDILPK